jgi:hypothetical protein
MGRKKATQRPGGSNSDFGFTKGLWSAGALACVVFTHARAAQSLSAVRLLLFYRVSFGFEKGMSAAKTES